jgi:endonuclease YncB( thermonuclease family)
VPFNTYPTPHLLGEVNYSGAHRFAPDGDTVHLLRPVLLVNGVATPPVEGKFAVWVTGANRARIIEVKQTAQQVPYVTVRLEGIDAPEEHYEATAFTQTVKGVKRSFPKRTNRKGEFAQPQWKAATDYLVGTLQRAGYALVQLDREVTDRYGRVLGYVHASDAQGTRGEFVSRELLARGLAFPFLFESAGDFIPDFLGAAMAARARKLGVWARYTDRPMATSSSLWPKPASYKSPEPAAQLKARLNLPMVFRRIVDTYQLQGLSLREALRKYDAIDYGTGKVFAGDRYWKVPVERRIWAPAKYN